MNYIGNVGSRAQIPVLAPIYMKIPHKNRRILQKPKRSRGYCFGCDANWIIPNIKCSVCGRIGEGRRKFKKHAPTIEEF